MENKPFRLFCLVLCALFFTYTSAQRLTPSPPHSTPSNGALDLRYNIFQTVLTGATPADFRDDFLFVDCENYRHNCNYTDDNDDCHDSDDCGGVSYNE